MIEKIRNEYSNRFNNFKANVLVNTDAYFALDWQNENGSKEYMISYVLDKRSGTLTISGDLGCAVLCWYNGMDEKKVASLISDTNYFISKMRASNRTYTFKSSDIKADLDELLGQNTPLEVQLAYEKCVCDTYFKASTELERLVKELDLPEQVATGYPYPCGKRVDPCAYLWQLGYELAMEQLEEEAA